MHPWKVASENEDTINESMAENFSLANHHSENIGNGIPPIETHIVSQECYKKETINNNGETITWLKMSLPLWIRNVLFYSEFLCNASSKLW